MSRAKSAQQYLDEAVVPEYVMAWFRGERLCPATRVPAPSCQAHGQCPDEAAAVVLLRKWREAALSDDVSALGDLVDDTTTFLGDGDIR